MVELTEDIYAVLLISLAIGILTNFFTEWFFKALDEPTTIYISTAISTGIILIIFFLWLWKKTEKPFKYEYKPK